MVPVASLYHPGSPPGSPQGASLFNVRLRRKELSMQSNQSGISVGSNLFSKVSMLLTGSMMVGALGAYLGQGIQSLGAMILLIVLFLGGGIAIKFIKDKAPTISIPLLLGWVFISGLFIGPAIHAYVAYLGWQTVFFAYLGTAGVMAVCGCIGVFSGFDFTNLGRYLMFALFGLIIFGIVSLFVHMSAGVTIVYSLIGMAVFAGFFIFDFFRLSKGANTWGNAIDITQDIYLDFINFLLYLLQLLAAAKDSKSRD